MSQVVVGRIERLTDRDVHIEVSIRAEAAYKRHPCGRLGEVRVGAQERLIVDEPQRVEGLVIDAAGLGVLSECGGLLMGLPRREVFVLKDPSPGDGLVAVVHDRAILVVAFSVNALEAERPIAKATEAVVKEAIQGARLEDVLEGIAGLRVQPLTEPHGDRRVV
jgi:hypothetical protein